MATPNDFTTGHKTRAWLVTVNESSESNPAGDRRQSGRLHRTDIRPLAPRRSTPGSDTRHEEPHQRHSGVPARGKEGKKESEHNTSCSSDRKWTRKKEGKKERLQYLLQFGPRRPLQRALAVALKQRHGRIARHRRGVILHTGNRREQWAEDTPKQRDGRITRHRRRVAL